MLMLRRLISAMVNISPLEQSLTTLSLSLSLQNKVMRGIARQLILKHHYLKQLSSSDEETDVLCLGTDEAGRELDQHMDLKQFLNITGLEPRTLNVCSTVTIEFTVTKDVKPITHNCSYLVCRAVSGRPLTGTDVVAMVAARAKG